MKKGLFIVFEGIDGSGKSTIISEIINSLFPRYKNIIHTVEPTNGRYGRLFRRLLEKKKITPELSLKIIEKDRKDNLKKNIIPNLNKGFIILQERYIYSTMAYQGAERELSGRKLLKLINIYEYPTPDIAFFLDVPPKIAINRISNRKKDQYEEQKFLEKVYAIYKEIEEKFPEVINIDGTVSQESVISCIKSIINWKIKSIYKTTLYI